MFQLVDYWESDLNRVSTMPYTSAQDFYPPCVCCGDLCSGWRIIRKSSDGKEYKDWSCVDCVNDLVKLKQTPIDLIKLL